jgi:hypothetical protein
MPILEGRIRTRIWSKIDRVVNTSAKKGPLQGLLPEDVVGFDDENVLGGGFIGVQLSIRRLSSRSSSC